MNIFLLSCTDNLEVNLKENLSQEIEKRGNKVAYISSQPQDDTKPYYLSTIVDYSEVGKNITVDYFDLSETFSDKKLNELLCYGTIYLSAGNKYTFMDSSNKRNLKVILEKHLNNNGLLVGASAGSIMMTPSIDLAEYGDENIPELKNTQGFNFLDFEFHPHFTDQTGEKSYLSDYKKTKNRIIYTCKDGGGIFYKNNQIKLFGGVAEFIN